MVYAMKGTWFPAILSSRTNNCVLSVRSPEEVVVPCPNQVHGNLPKAAIAGITVAVVFGACIYPFIDWPVT